MNAQEARKLRDDYTNSKFNEEYNYIIANITEHAKMGESHWHFNGKSSFYSSKLKSRLESDGYKVTIGATDPRDGLTAYRISWE